MKNISTWKQNVIPHPDPLWGVMVRELAFFFLKATLYLGQGPELTLFSECGQGPETNISCDLDPPKVKGCIFM